MKGSPIIATAITIVILLGLYIAMRTIILPEVPEKSSSHHDDHDHDGGHEGHDHGADNTRKMLDTEFEIYFSSIPKSLKITQPIVKKEIVNTTDLDSAEWSGSSKLGVNGHLVELLVEVEWQSPNDINFVQIIVSPDSYASEEATLRGSGNISDIAEFNW